MSHRFDEAGPRISGALLGICVAGVLQIAALDEPDVALKTASKIFAGLIPVLLALWGSSSDVSVHKEVSGDRRKLTLWKLLLGFAAVGTALAWSDVLSHIWPDASTVFWWSCLAAFFLFGYLVPDGQKTPSQPSSAKHASTP